MTPVGSAVFIPWWRESPAALLGISPACRSSYPPCAAATSSFAHGRALRLITLHFRRAGSAVFAEPVHERGCPIAIDATPYSVYKIRNDAKRLDEREICAPAAQAQGCPAWEIRQSAGRRRASRNKTTPLLDGEALGLTRRAVEAALAGDMFW
jgi:hypothetical protein